MVSFLRRCRTAMSPALMSRLHRLQAQQHTSPMGPFYTVAAEAPELDRKFNIIIVPILSTFSRTYSRFLSDFTLWAHSGRRLLLNFHNCFWQPALQLCEMCGLVADHPTYVGLTRKTYPTSYGLPSGK